MSFDSYPLVRSSMYAEHIRKSAYQTKNKQKKQKKTIIKTPLRLNYIAKIKAISGCGR